MEGKKKTEGRVLLKAGLQQLKVMSKTIDEQQVVQAAEIAKSLSELLKMDDLLIGDGLRWLENKHIDKFYDAISEVEAAELWQLGRLRRYSDEKVATAGFPLLDWLWVIGRGRNFERSSLTTFAETGSGRKLVVRLAQFQPEWVGTWWRWRCETGRGNIYYRDDIERAVLSALTGDEFRTYWAVLPSDLVAKIIGLRPEFVEHLPSGQRGQLLGRALVNSLENWATVATLTQHNVPADADAVVDHILGSSADKGLNLLDKLINEWRNESNPVAIAMTHGHSGLEELLRSQWNVDFESSSNRKERKFWTHPFQYRSASAALIAGVRARPDRFILELGFSLGLRIAEESREPSLELIQAHLKNFNIDARAVRDALLPMVDLWASLRTLAKYQKSAWQHDTELVGLRTKVASIAAANPGFWAQSLPWILNRSSELGDVPQAVTLAIASEAPEVRHALENACNDDDQDIRLKSRGLSTLLYGLEDPESGLARTLADAAAHYIDGTPLFPHPLNPLSATWLGSIGVEQAIENGIHRAGNRFSAEVSDQGGDIEEALTKALVKEIEAEFRQIRPRLKLIASKPQSAAPFLSVKQRPISKSIEEPVYGCDLAWIVDATISRRLRGTWVDLVQVKKSMLLQKRRTALRTESWKIECKQLNDILNWSATAVYWLIASAGEVLVIPAKYLSAIRNGKAKTAVETFTVGYHEIRTVAVPLQQYLVQLLIGQWVGTSSDDVIRFARGENSNIRPRAVIEVTISVSLDKQ